MANISPLIPTWALNADGTFAGIVAHEILSLGVLLRCFHGHKTVTDARNCACDQLAGYCRSGVARSPGRSGGRSSKRYGERDG